MRGRCSASTNSPPEKSSPGSDRHLKRERQRAVEVLVQAIVVARAVLQQKRRRTRLAGRVAEREERGVRFRTARLKRHALVPGVRNRRKSLVKRSAQGGDRLRKRIGELFVLALPEAVVRHDDVAAEAPILRIERRNRAAFSPRQQLLEHGSPVLGSTPRRRACVRAGHLPLRPVAFPPVPARH
jgi:hypothetical protein